MFLDLTRESGYCYAHLLKPLAISTLPQDGMKMRVLARLRQTSIVTPKPSPAKGFLNYKEARDYMHTVRISQNEWALWSETNRPSNIPPNPNSYYKGYGWRSWNKFLGSTNNNSITNQTGFMSKRNSLKRSTEQLIDSNDSPRFKVRFTEPMNESQPIIADFISQKSSPLSSCLEEEEVRSETLILKKYEKSPLSFIKAFEPLQSQAKENNITTDQNDEILTELLKLQSSLKQIEEKNRASSVIIYKRVVEESTLLPLSLRTPINTAVTSTLKR